MCSGDHYPPHTTIPRYNNIPSRRDEWTVSPDDGKYVSQVRARGRVTGGVVVIMQKLHVFVNWAVGSLV